MIGGSLNGNTANAKHRRYHYRTHRRIRRNANKYGYYKHGRYYRYKNGYFHNGRWIHYRYNVRRRRKVRYRKSHKRYRTYDGKSVIYNEVMYGMANPSKSMLKQFNHKSNKVNHHAVNHKHKKHTIKNGLKEGSFGLVPINKYWENYYDKQENRQLLDDINKDREKYGRSPLVESKSLDKIAQMHANQIAHSDDILRHVDPKTNRYYAEEDAQRLGYSDYTSKDRAENIGQVSLGDSFDDAVPITSKPTRLPEYNNKNGYDMANENEDNMMKYDQDNNNAHRNNILNSKYTKIGIGTAYSNAGNDDFDSVEDFTN